MQQVRLFLSESDGFSRLALRFGQFLIDSSLWTAAALASLVFFVQQTLRLPLDRHPIALIFFAALTFYNLDRFADAFLPNSDQRLACFRRQAGVLLILSAGIATVILLMQAPIAVQQVSVIGLLPLVYGIPLLLGQRNGQRRWYRLKDLPGAKAWIVCGTIAFALTAVPLAYANQSFTPAAILTAIFLLMLTGSNAHMFDVRDLEDDRLQGVPTLPVLWGLLPTRILLTGMNAIGMMALLGGWMNGWNVPSLAIVLPLTLLTLICIWAVTPETERSVYNVWIEGLLFLPALSVGLM